MNVVATKNNNKVDLDYFSKDSNGTFNFCEGCPGDNNCCTGKSVDLPVLIPSDIINISNEMKLPANVFSTHTNGTLSEMKARKGKCFFYEKDRCTIYHDRPIDCRLFPFDIKKSKENKLMLVQYSTTCPKPIETNNYTNDIMPLLSSLRPFFREFAEHRSPLLNKHSYSVVRLLR
jgi:Fe-S-cluster containining protein